MTERDLIVLVFAPATLGLVATGLRRVPAWVFWLSLTALLTLGLWGVSLRYRGVDALVNDPLLLGGACFGLPTIVAFVVARLQPVSIGGSWVFTAACTAYLLTLCTALGAGVALGLLSL